MSSVAVAPAPIAPPSLSPLLELNKIWATVPNTTITSPSKTSTPTSPTTPTSPNGTASKPVVATADTIDAVQACTTVLEKCTLNSQLGDVKRIVNLWQNHPSFHAAHDSIMQKICPGFQGLSSTNPSVWAERINFNSIEVIHYLEIGACHGAAFISVIRNYHKSYNNVYDLIEPYEGAEDVQGQAQLLRNNLVLAKVPIYNLRLFHEHYQRVIANLNDEFYNLVYINNNICTTERVLEDMMLAWRRVQSGGGAMIINRYGNDNKPGKARHAIDMFVHGFAATISHHFPHKGLYFIFKASFLGKAV